MASKQDKVNALIEQSAHCWHRNDVEGVIKHVKEVLEIGASEIGASEIGSSKIGASEIGVSEINASEIGASKIGVSKIGVSEIGVDRNSLFYCETKPHTVAFTRDICVQFARILNRTSKSVFDLENGHRPDLPHPDRAPRKCGAGGVTTHTIFAL